MFLEEGIFTIVTADPNLAALLGDRIYPIRMPQEPTLPAVAYQLVSGNSDYSLSGDSEYRTALVQISAFAKTFPACVDLAEKLIKALSAYRGSAAQIDVQLIKHVNTIDIPEDEPHEYDLFHRALDFEISYLTTGPDP